MNCQYERNIFQLKEKKIEFKTKKIVLFGGGQNVEVMTDEKLPNRLTGLHRRQIHCPRLRKYSNYFHKLWKIFHEEQKYGRNC